MGLTLTALVAVATIGLLFFAATWGDSSRADRLFARHRPVIYGLSLGVYFTSWTFYGAVGSASSRGWDYLPIYLGPILALTLGYPILRRLVAVGRRHASISIADILAHRYGKSATMAALVSVIAVVGALPYIALQLTSISESLSIASGMGLSANPWFGLGIAVTLAIFAILFGARRPDSKAHNRGLVLAVAMETVVKLLALVAMAVFALVLLRSGTATGPEATATVSPFDAPVDGLRFVVSTGLAFLAILCLPRQFHLMVVEAQETDDLRSGRWIFLASLGITALVVIPIAQAGQQILNGSVAGDLYMLALPAAHDLPLLSILVFAGGVAAATGMVIVSTLALSIMVSNDLINAVLLRLSGQGRRAEIRSAQQQLMLRRAVIVGIILIAWVLSRSLVLADTLAGFGLLAFAAAAQFAPAMLGGLYWPKGNRLGAMAGLAVGFGCWLVFLVAPAAGLLNRPSLGISADPFALWTLVSLSLNSGLYVLLSVMLPDRVVDRVQAARVAGQPRALPRTLGNVTVGDLRAIVAHCLGEDQATRAFEAFELAYDRVLVDRDPVDGALVSFAEKQIARSLGSASARVVLSTMLTGGNASVQDLTLLLGEARQRQRFSHELLEATLENMSQGVAVIDRDMRMVAWNRAYLELFEYPAGFLTIGKPIRDVIRFNAERGLAGTQPIDAYVDSRVAHYRSGSRHRFERPWRGGRILEIEGNPLPGGGYVTTFTDVTDSRLAAQSLRETAESLERRVAQRTRALTEANAALDEARLQAEQATRSKTRFLAAASHDLMQPLNAARLFASALSQSVEGDARAMTEKLDQSIRAADQLIRALLNISKLDAGGLTPDRGDFRLADLFADLAHEFEILAEDKGLALTVMPTSEVVHSDRGLLFSVLQNLLSNAVRYTGSGRVLIGARRRADCVEVQVLDTGPGIPEDKLDSIFEEFVRLGGGRANGLSPSDDQGVGLGLAITRRISDLLQAELTVRSLPGRGSCFAVRVPRGQLSVTSLRRETLTSHGRLEGRVVLCVDNDAQVLAGERALLEHWGCRVLTAATQDEALAELARANGMPDLLLLDHQLDDGVTGLDVFDAVTRELGYQLPAIMVTADAAQVPEMAGMPVLSKPIEPGVLRATMEQRLALDEAAE